MKPIAFDVDDRGVATLRLNRPEVRNAFNEEVMAEITRAVRHLTEEVRVLVLAGEGKAFSAGADLNWMRGMVSSTRAENLADSSLLRDMLEALDSTRVPVVGRIHGAAIAGAVGLVACCDYAVAARSTVFSIAEVRLGLVPSVISPYVIRKIGYGSARALFLSGERFDGQRAYEIGLVHRVVDDEEIDTAVDEVVEMFLMGGPEALRVARDLLDRVWGRSPDEVGDLTVETIAERRVSNEGQEGVTSFLEKRPPRWVPQSR